MIRTHYSFGDLMVSIFMAVAMTLFMVWFFGCSVTVGTVNLSEGKPKVSTEIVQEKPVTVNTDAQVPISVVP